MVIPTYISSMSDYQVRALSGSFAPTNGSSSIQSVTPSEWVNSDPGVYGVGAVVEKWGGGFKAVSGTKLFVHGGGHSDSANNGVYTFDFSGTSAPTGWTVQGQSAVAAVQNNESYSDGRPTSVHLYDGGVFAHHNGFGYRFGGSRYQTGAETDGAWRFNPATGAWTALTNVPAPSHFGYAQTTAYDPVSGKILLTYSSGSSPPMSYVVFRTNTAAWSAIKTVSATWGEDSDYRTMAYDSTRSRALMLGDGFARLLTIDWTAETTTVSTPSLSSTTPQNLVAPALFYDFAADRFWAMGGGSNGTPGLGYTNIYEIHPTTFTVTAHTLSGNSISTGPEVTGSFGRFVFLAPWRAVGIVSSATSAAYVVKLPAAQMNVGTVQDERDTYTAMGWTWSTSVEPSAVTEPIGGGYPVIAASTDVHDETEGDDLWTYLQMYRRSGNTVYLDRLNRWATYFKTLYRVSSPFASEDVGFLLDHFYGYGMLALYEYNGDAAALAEALNLGAFLETHYGGATSCLASNACLQWNARGAGRHLIFATELYRVTGTARWGTLRDLIITKILGAPEWNATRGMYFWGNDQQDSQLDLVNFPNNAYSTGLRVTSPFQIALLVEGMDRAYRATGNATLQTRIVSIARYVQTHGLNATYQYTSSIFGSRSNGTSFHNYVDDNVGPVTFWDGVYTTSLVNVLVRGYKYTGDTALLTLARTYFNRGTKSVFGSPTARKAGDTVAQHFMDTTFDSSTSNIFLAENKGELLYTYLLFENGGSPTVEAAAGGAPSPPTGLRFV